MAKPEWGTKRTCQSCGARFYDLRRDPITCPVCAAIFDPDRQPRVKRGGPAVKEEPAVAAAVVGAEKGLVDDTADVDAEASEDVELEEIDDAVDDGDDDLDTGDDESNDLMEDTSELGEDDDDLGEVMEHVNDDLDENL